MGADCEYAKLCVRYAYSRYLLEKGYDVPPNRVVVCMQLKIDIAFIKHGIYTEHMPLMRNGQPFNLCPAMLGELASNCHEFIKETKRLDSLAKAREKSRQYFTNKNKRLWIPPETRQEVARRDHYTCVYCHRYQNQLWNGKKVKGCVDHVIPLAIGGDEKDLGNLAFSCVDCNQAKGSDVWQFGCRVGFYHEC